MTEPLPVAVARLEGKVDILITLATEDRADRRVLHERVDALENARSRDRGVYAAVLAGASAVSAYFSDTIKHWLT